MIQTSRNAAASGDRSVVRFIVSLFYKKNKSNKQGSLLCMGNAGNSNYIFYIHIRYVILIVMYNQLLVITQ